MTKISNWFNLEITQHDLKEDVEYEEQLKELGWCLSCQGYGQDHSDGSDCLDCNGTGFINKQNSDSINT